MSKTQGMSKKKLSALMAIPLVIGAAGAGFVVDDSSDVAVLSEKVDNLTLEKETLMSESNAKDTKIAELVKTVDSLKGDLSEYDSVIEEAVFEDMSVETAKAYVLRKDHKLRDWLESEYGLSIEDEEDLSISFVEKETEVSDVDMDDGEATVYFELRVEGFEDGDDDLDFVKHVSVTVELEDGDAESISFAEA